VTTVRAVVWSRICLRRYYLAGGGVFNNIPTSFKRAAAVSWEEPRLINVVFFIRFPLRLQSLPLTRSFPVLKRGLLPLRLSERPACCCHCARNSCAFCDIFAATRSSDALSGNGHMTYRLCDNLSVPFHLLKRGVMGLIRLRRIWKVI